MIVNGWTLLFHDAVIGQLKNLADAYERGRKADPNGFRANANVKLLAALAKLMLEVILTDLSRAEYRQGNTLGEGYRHWFRAKFFRRFRLFFRYDSRARLIVHAWVNDERTLRQRGGKSDPYAVFRQMLESGNPPNDWAALVGESRSPSQGHAIVCGSRCGHQSRGSERLPGAQPIRLELRLGRRQFCDLIPRWERTVGLIWQRSIHYSASQ